MSNGLTKVGFLRRKKRRKILAEDALRERHNVSDDLASAIEGALQVMPPLELAFKLRTIATRLEGEG